MQGAPIDVSVRVPTQARLEQLSLQLHGLEWAGLCGDRKNAVYQLAQNELGVSALLTLAQVGLRLAGEVV